MVMVVMGVPVITVIVWIAVVMVTIIIMPVVRTPGTPPVRVVTPVPGRTPDHISGQKDEPHQRPGSYLISCHPVYHHGLSFHITGVTNITRIGCFIISVGIIIGFNDIVLTIQGLIPDQLDANLVIGFTLDVKDGHVLVLTGIDGHLQYDHMNIPVSIIDHPDVVDPVVPVQIKVIDPAVLIIQTAFKTLKGFRFLKEFHHGKEVQIVSRQTQVIVIIFPGLCHRRSPY
jgi:hypothetical protein